MDARQSGANDFFSFENPIKIYNLASSCASPSDTFQYTARHTFVIIHSSFLVWENSQLSTFVLYHATFFNLPLFLFITNNNNNRTLLAKAISKNS